MWQRSVGGAAVGSTVRITNVVCGIPPEQLEGLIREKTLDLQDLSATQRQLISNLQKELDLNQRQVRAAFDILGEKDIPAERLAAKLVEIAERFKECGPQPLSSPVMIQRWPFLKRRRRTPSMQAISPEPMKCWLM